MNKISNDMKKNLNESVFLQNFLHSNRKTKITKRKQSANLNIYLNSLKMSNKKRDKSENYDLPKSKYSTRRNEDVKQSILMNPSLQERAKNKSDQKMKGFIRELSSFENYLESNSRTKKDNAGYPAIKLSIFLKQINK